MRLKRRMLASDRRRAHRRAPGRKSRAGADPASFRALLAELRPLRLPRLSIIPHSMRGGGGGLPRPPSCDFFRYDETSVVMSALRARNDSLLLSRSQRESNMLGSMDSPSSSEETVLRRESQSSLIRQAAELAADRPAEMMSEKEIEQARQARALADAASAGGKSPSGRSPITERRASRVPHGTRPTAEFDADAAFWQGHGANAISAAAFAYDRSGKVEIGTPGDHFSLAWEHIKEGFSLLFKAMLPAASPGPSSPHRPRSPEKPVGSGDDDEDEEETMKRIVREAGVILPTDPWKEMWDVFILVLIIYSAIAVPYRICFESPASGMVWIFEQLLTAAFMVDVGFNFNTAHSDNADSWVTDRREIALRYLSGWFWIDAPACVPVELLDAVLAGEQKQMGLLRFLRLFRLIRLLRLLKVRIDHALARRRVPQQQKRSRCSCTRSPMHSQTHTHTTNHALLPCPARS